MKADQEETESRHEDEEEEEEEEIFDLNDFNQDTIPDIVIKQEEPDEEPIPINGPYNQNGRKRQISYQNYRRIKRGRSPYVYSMDQPETEFDIFCRSVALQLNNMPLENALRLQHNIQNMVTEERLNCLQNQQNKHQRSD